MILQSRHRLIRAALAVLAGSALIVLTACGTSTTAATSAASSSEKTAQPAAQPPPGQGAPASSAEAGTPIGVVAGENFWGDLIAQIGGDHVRVTSIVSDPNADPHGYESSAKDAAALAAAGLVLKNGVGYDDFMDKLLRVSPNAKREVLTVAEILHVSGQNANPHLWYATARLPEVARAVSAELSKLDPAHAADFATRERKFDDSLQPILAVIAQIKSKYSGTPIAYTERVPGYLTQAAGLTLGNPPAFTEAVEQGNDPSPADTAAFDAVITGKKVKVLLYNGQVTDRQTTDIKNLAATSGVPVVGVTETIPASDATFQAWQLRQVKELLAALGG